MTQLVCFNTVRTSTNDEKEYLCGNIVITGLTGFKALDIMCPRCHSTDSFDGVGDDWSPAKQHGPSVVFVNLPIQLR
jgi:hypothetical protein